MGRAQPSVKKKRGRQRALSDTKWHKLSRLLHVVQELMRQISRDAPKLLLVTRGGCLHEPAAHRVGPGEHPPRVTGR
jgi:hypothetical protein